MDSQQIDVFIKRPVKCIAAKKNFSGKGQTLIYTKSLFLQEFFMRQKNKFESNIQTIFFVNKIITILSYLGRVH